MLGDLSPQLDKLKQELEDIYREPKVLLYDPG